MPGVTIEIRREYTYKQEIQLMEAVRSAMKASLNIPLDNINIRLILHAPHRFTIPSDRDNRFTLISIDLFTGRSLEAKRALFQAIVNNLAALDIPADHVKTVLRENTRDNWGVRGGFPASEVNLGYEINI